MKQFWAALVLAAFAAGGAQAQAPRPMAVEYGAWPPAFALAEQRAMTRALAGLAPRTPGQRNVYVLTGALFGQHVFDHEAGAAADVLAAHFHAQGHTIVLSNYYGLEAPARPAASPANIEAAIGRIAELMDKDADVIVIFLTSHGGPNSGMAGLEPIPGTDGQPLEEYQLLPGRLRGALDAAGIKNRIFILSACFSGQFVPTLQDANTIVMTAASAERSSFGCQAENEWTYFGDAMFNTALPQSPSLLGAFEAAKRQIGAEEAQGNLTPSQPQISIGANARKALAEIER